MLTVASSRLGSTMSSLRTSRKSNPQTNSPQVKRVKLTLMPGIYQVYSFSWVHQLLRCSTPNSAKSWQPKKFTKHSHPLFLLVSSPVFLVLHSLLTQFGHFNFSEEAWLLKPHDAPTGNQSPELQVEKIWQIYLLWESLHLSHFCDFSDSFWTSSLHSFRKTM